MSSEVTAKDVMEANVISIEPECSLREAWSVLSRQRISGLPVVSESRGLVGVISQSDILQIVLDGQISSDAQSYYIGAPFWENELLGDAVDKLEATSVEQVMSASVISVSPDDAVSTIAVLMRSNHIHRVIVADGNEAIGIITALDLLKVLENH